MKKNLLINFSIDRKTTTIKVEREFAAPIEKVRAAWTESKIIDQWWAPKPWKARTKTMDFRVGGHHLYAMVGPDGTEHWARADFISIEPFKNYSVKDSFCDEHGKRNQEFPSAIRTNTFKEIENNTTLVTIKIQYEKLSDIKKVIEMGFKEGFTAALENLDKIVINI